MRRGLSPNSIVRADTNISRLFNAVEMSVLKKHGIATKPIQSFRVIRLYVLLAQIFCYVPNSRIIYLRYDLAKIAETEASDKVRRLANQLVLDKLRARLNGKHIDDDK